MFSDTSCSITTTTTTTYNDTKSPGEPDLTGCILKAERHCFAYSASADLWKGSCHGSFVRNRTGLVSVGTRQHHALAQVQHPFFR